MSHPINPRNVRGGLSQGQRILVPPVFQEFLVSSETVPEMQYESARDGAQHHQDDEYNPPRVRPELATLEVPHVREVPVRRGRHHGERDDRHDVPDGVGVRAPVPLEQGERCSDQCKRRSHPRQISPLVG
ncbi:hypothetical protein THAOC_00125 [Thalassiosira oceanica]|uniref:Uncharacterized protein n=1 Tax=Thalassiosira oceanica TaxID=159749 RepID=K0TPJ7_THAOC|nr:hypothetical protein THAOC_00125 [Thalassiosira oceanica]|eukprot:EJK78001.1 hypothetical protein THAOC_00125 [Thalassiosira oceanica]